MQFCERIKQFYYNTHSAMYMDTKSVIAYQTRQFTIIYKNNNDFEQSVLCAYIYIIILSVPNCLMICAH